MNYQKATINYILRDDSKISREKYEAGTKLSFESNKVIDITEEIKNRSYHQIFADVYQKYKMVKKDIDHFFKHDDIWFIADGKLVAYMYPGDRLSHTLNGNTVETAVLFDIEISSIVIDLGLTVEGYQLSAFLIEN